MFGGLLKIYDGLLERKWKMLKCHFGIFREFVDYV